MRLILEIILCARGTGDRVRFHPVRTDITERCTDPDTIMNDQLARLGFMGEKGARYAHSTSWRYEAGETLLTYLVWVGRAALEGVPFKRVSLTKVACPQSVDPMIPRPLKICMDHVVVHGLRHLRYLIYDQQETTIAQCLGNRKILRLLHKLEPALAGRIACKKSDRKGRVGAAL